MQRAGGRRGDRQGRARLVQQAPRALSGVGSVPWSVLILIAGGRAGAAVPCPHLTLTTLPGKGIWHHGQKGRWSITRPTGDMASSAPRLGGGSWWWPRHKAACGHHLAGWVLGAVGRPQLLPCSTCLLRFLQSIDPGQQFTWENSNLEVNKPKNRYANVIAYDHSRVILTSLDGEPKAVPLPSPCSPPRRPGAPGAGQAVVD